MAYNPIRQISLVELSMTENAVSRALLYAAAVCSTLAKGERESSEVSVQTIGYVNGWLAG